MSRLIKTSGHPSAIWNGFAPGKLILSGEHSVVYGHSAIAMAVNLGISIVLTPIEGPSQCPQADSNLWTVLQNFVPKYGLHIDIQSQLPLGRGMGSSAALSIALIRALAQMNNRIPTFTELFEKGMEMEKHFHGNPSGVDHTVSALGKTVLYQKGPPPQIQPLQIPEISLLVLDSGSAGNTSELVCKVAQSIHLPKVQQSIENMARCTEDILHNFTHNQDLNQLGQLFTHNHELLSQIGVSTPLLDQMVEEAISQGALGAKLSGAGGGGVVMALLDPTQCTESILTHFSNLGYKPFVVQPYRESP